MVMTPKKLQKQCDDWNKAYPVGTEVVLTDDWGERQSSENFITSSQSLITRNVTV